MAFELIAGTKLHWPIRHVVFDWDGTLSLIRSGWAEVMVDLFLSHLGAGDRAPVLDAILQLNGHPTSRQIAWLVEELPRRGLPAGEAKQYLGEFADRLQAVIERRLAGDREKLLVQGAREMIAALQLRGLTLHLASGTAHDAVCREAELLGLAEVFAGRIHGAPTDDRPFSKQAIIEEILRTAGLAGEALLAFGDGEVEIRATRAAGGLAVAVASDELHPGSGQVDAEKRERLLGAGAQVVIPDFREPEALLEQLLGMP